MSKEVKRILSNKPAGLYRCLKACEIYIGKKRQYIPEGKVVKLAKGEANKHFQIEKVSNDVPTSEKSAAIINALDKLDADNLAHWTKTGLPRLSVIQTMVSDLEISQKDVAAARPGFCRTTLEIEEADKETVDEGTFGQGSDERSKNHQEI